MLGATLGVTLSGAVLFAQIDQTPVNLQAVADNQTVQIISTDPLDTVVPQLDIAVPQPDIAVTQPDIAVTQPDIAVTQPDTAVTQPDTAVTQSSASAPVFRAPITRTRRS